MENNKIAAKYSERVKSARKPPALSTVLNTWANIAFVFNIIIALVILGIGIAEDDLIIIAIPLAIVWAFLAKLGQIIVKGIAEVVHNINITAQMSILNTMFNVETATGCDIAGGSLTVSSSNDTPAPPKNHSSIMDKFGPSLNDNSWVCSCGTKNKAGATYCVSCGNKKQ